MNTTDSTSSSGLHTTEYLYELVFIVTWFVVKEGSGWIKCLYCETWNKSVIEDDIDFMPNLQQFLLYVKLFTFPQHSWSAHNVW